MTAAVVLRVGSRTRVIGTLDVSESPTKPEAAVLDAFEEEAARELLEAHWRAQSRLRAVADARRLLAYKEQLVLAVRAAPFGDPTGPVLRAMRQEAGIPLTALAKTIGRSPGFVRGWEVGRSTSARFSDLSRASEALGYSPQAILEVSDAIAQELIPDRPTPKAAEHRYSVELWDRYGLPPART